MTDREVVETFVRASYTAKPPTEEELKGNTLEEEVLWSVNYLLRFPKDVLVIRSIIETVSRTPDVNIEDLPDLGMPGKTSSFWKVYNGWD